MSSGTTDPGASDWSDLDLLTKEEAAQRLHAETDAVAARIAALTQSGVPDHDAELVAARQRLELLARRLAD